MKELYSSCGAAPACACAGTIMVAVVVGLCQGGTRGKKHCAHHAPHAPHGTRRAPHGPHAAPGITPPHLQTRPQENAQRPSCVPPWGAQATHRCATVCVARRCFGARWVQRRHRRRTGGVGRLPRHHSPPTHILPSPPSHGPCSGARPPTSWRHTTLAWQLTAWERGRWAGRCTGAAAVWRWPRWRSRRWRPTLL